MPFNDALIGNNDFDPRTATESLIRDSEDQPTPTVDVRLLNTRLARKLDEQTRNRVKIEGMPEKPATPDQSELDFSSQAAPPAAPPPSSSKDTKDLDFSADAVQPEEAKPEKKNWLGARQEAKGLGKGIVHGAIEGTGSVLQGLGTMAGAESMSPAVLAASTGVDPQTEWQLPGERPNPEAPVPGQDITKNSAYQAGKTIKKAAEDVAPMTPEEKDSIGGRIGTGLGTIAPYAAAAMVNAPLGIAAGFTGMAASTYGDTYEAAKEKGASDEAAHAAADWAGMTAGTLGSLPLGAGKLVNAAWAKIAASGVVFASLGEAQDALLQEIAKNYYDKDAGYSPDAKRIIAALAVGGIVGATHAIGDSGAQPQRGTGAPGPGAPGGALPGPAPGAGGPHGGPRSSPEDIADFLHRARTGNRDQHTSSDTSQESSRMVDPATMSDAELMREFEQARHETGMSMREMLRQLGGFSDHTIDNMGDRGQVEQAILAARGLKSEQAQRGTETGSEGKTTAQQPEPEPSAAGPKAERAASEPDQVKHADYAVLREYGYSDEDIGNMSAAQRTREVSDAFAEGIKPGAVMDKYPLPEAFKGAAAAESTGAPVDRGGAAGTRDVYAEAEKLVRETGNGSTSHLQRKLGLGYAEAASIMSRLEKAGVVSGQDHKGARTVIGKETSQETGTRSSPIEATTADHVLAAQPIEPVSEAQAKAENYKHAHVELPQLGLSGQHSISVETGVGQERKGVGPDGAPWSVVMQHAAYGRIKGTRGADGQALDVFVGPHPSSQHVFVIDQHEPGKGFDEHKIMVGFRTPIDAMHAYANAFNDGATGRIGGIVAMGPEEFKAWLAGDTTRAISGHEVIPPGKLAAEPTEDHHQQIEAVLGQDYDHVLPVDIQRAAEILADNEGVTPEEAFGRAVAENTVEQGFLTEQEAVQAYGEEIKDVLESGSEGTSGGGTPAEQGGAAPEQESAGHPEEAGEPARGGEAGEGEGSVTTGGGENRQQHDTERKQPDTERETGGAADEEAAIAAEDAANAAGRANEVARQRHLFAVERATDERWKELVDPDVKDVHPGDIFAAVRLGVENGSLSLKNARELMRESGEEELPKEEIIDILARSKIEKLQGGEVVQFPYKDEHAQGRMWATIFGMENGYIGKERKPTAKLKKLIENPPEPLPEPGSEKPQRLEDAGEKIGGARKDKWIGEGGLKFADLDNMNAIERAKAAVKQNIWPRPDYAAAVEDGVDPVAAALMKRVYDRLPVKPNEQYGGSKPLLQAYIDVLNMVRSVMEKAKTVEAMEDLSSAVKLDYYERTVIWPARSKMNPLIVSAGDVSVAKRAVEQGFPNIEPWKRLFEVGRGYKSAIQADQSAFQTKLEEASKAFEADGVSLDYSYGAAGKAGTIRLRKWKGTEPVEVDQLSKANQQLYLDLLEARDKAHTKEVWNVFRKNGGQISSHDTKEIAEKAAADAYAKLGDERKQGPQEPTRPHLDHVMRSGPDYRNGRNVTGDDFIKDFGVRGVEFGNWLAGDERQKSVNLAYDALHDLARVLNIPPKALSLNGTLALAFGARGQGGRAAAHYEPARTVMNLTKISGAGTVAHEYGHALDHYLGNLGGFKELIRSISGWDTERQKGYYEMSKYRYANSGLPPKLRVAVNKLMHDLFHTPEAPEAAENRVRASLEEARGALQNWQEHLARIRARKAGGKSGAGTKQAEHGVDYWGRKVSSLEQQLRDGIRIDALSPSLYHTEAKKLGDYWSRPNEMFARAFETFVHDKIKGEGFESQYLVQGVEPNRFGNGFKGNPYPTGTERDRVNADFDRVVQALAVGENSRLEGMPGEPGPIEEVTKVHKPVAQPTNEETAKAVDQASVANLSQAFERHFGAGKGFSGILEARKFAREAGFNEDAKAVEEAIEAAVVRQARTIAHEPSFTPAKKYAELRHLYEKQPRLGTRTSTSIRDQAYSTPVPLAYLAARLAGITDKTTVYEPTAGNGALLITADPAKATVNEINPDRAKNLREQGFKVMEYDATTDTPRNQIENKGVDAVITNPPFGPIKEGGVSKVFDLSGDLDGLNYRTSEADHAIAIKALDAMKDDGKAVLILGGVNKLVSTDQGRADAYQGKAKREFFKALYDNYRVTDHFTVNGDLYARQGAGWPVDVVVIDGRGKSALPLPAVKAPRIYNDWNSLGGLLDGQQATSRVQPSGDQTGVTSDSGTGLEGRGGADRGGAGTEQSGPVESGSVRGKSGTGTTETGARGGVTGNEPGRRGQDVEPGGAREQSPAVDDFDAAFDAALDEAYGAATPPKVSKPAKVGGEAAARTTGEVAKETVKAAKDAADEGFSALYDLFGGNKSSSGFTFDEDTYRKAKPHFEAAAGKFAEFKNNLGELLRRMVAHMRDALKWPREVMERIRPYLKRFIDEMNAKPEAPRKEALKAEPTETENQVVYKPQSGVKGLDTLAPVNMARPMADSLKALESRVGPIDHYVAGQLGYSPSELEKYFGAEQVDALGLAIDNLDRGKGFIIGDQTGIGKGRVNAAIIRWAIKQGRIPVFVTEKPNLYKDMFRDLMDIGITDNFLTDKPRILATNAALKLPLEEGNGATIDTGDAKSHNKHMLDVVDNFGGKYDMVFTTYNQMQTQKGEDTARRQFLQRMSNKKGGIVLIIDEAHNAGGQKVERKSKDDVPGRAEFTRDLINKANGVFYSSATYAKRPDVMDLYAATDMAMAVDNISDLAEAISRGGVPMQQAVASMLARAGQYVRRERSFAGINYNTPTIPVDRKTYNEIAKSLAAIQQVSKFAKKGAEGVGAQLRAEGKAMGADMSTGEGGASSTNFTAVMHNVINQMLLAMKSKAAADRAIENIKAGEKPVLTVANTMEAFLQDYADNLGIKPGDEMPGDFSHVLRKYLDRSRTILIKKPFAKKGDKPERHYLTDDELGPAGVAVYDHARSIIDGMDLSALPISPIDYMKGQLKKAGYDTGEVTGRTMAVDYTGKVPVLTTRPGAEKTPRGRTKTIEQFNTKPQRGGVHALIINQAGSTGLSAHASEKFNDQSKRRMIIVQPEANIDTHMQLLGRVNRTGQVVLPEYDQLVLDAPAEKRPAAVLAKKMASLNANTTASRSSAVTAKDVPDFINQYGDEIAASWVRDNLEEHFNLASPLSISEEGKVDKTDAMRKLTGRIPLLELEKQEALYGSLESEYAALIAQLDAAGENALEAKSVDLKAKLLERMEVQGKRNESGSPFAAPVVLQKVSVARIGKPFSPKEIVNRLHESLDPESKGVGENMPPDMIARQLEEFSNPYGIIGKKVVQHEITERKAAQKAFTDYTRPIIDEMEKPEDQAKARNKFIEQSARWSTTHEMLKLGQRVVIKTASGNLTGIVMDVHQTGAPKNPLALGSWKANFAIADASRQLTVPFSRIFENGKSPEEDALAVEVAPLHYERAEQTLARYQHMQGESREERYIAGGNMLAAYDWLDRKGAIVNYTSEKGTVHQGILTARDFDPKKQAVAHGHIEKDPAKIKAFLDDTLDRIWAKDGNIAIQKDSRYGSDYLVTAEKAKAKGGKYYLDNKLTALTGDFIAKGGNMVSYIRPGDFDPVLRRLQELGAEFKMAAKTPIGEKVGEEDNLAAIRPSYDVAPHLTPEQQNQVKALAEAAIRKMVGNHVDVGFLDEAPPLEAAANEKWGGVNAVAAAQYWPRRALIELALDSNLETNIPHEAYHAIEYQLQTPEERALMQRETPRIREAIRDYAKDKFKLNDAQIDKLAGEEVRAIGMEAYMEGRLKGAHVGARRWYQKLWDMLKGFAAKLRGAGFERFEDIYEKARSGGYRNASGATPRPEAMGEALAAIRPGGNRSGPPAMSETIEQHLRDRGYTRAANLSKKLGIGAFNTTEARTLIQDKMIRVRKAEDSVANTNTALSAHQAESLYYGRTGERLERLEEDHFDPLIKEMSAADISMGDLNAYLYARHAPERNAYIDTINPNLGGEGSGMSDADAAAIMAGIPAAKLADYQRLAARVDQIQSDTVDTLVAYGLISQDTADAWRNQYQHYVPLRGFAEGTEDEGQIGRGKGYDQRAKVTKAAFGRVSEADGPLQYVMMQAESAIVRGEKNRVGNTFLRFVRANPDADRWQVNAPTLKRRIDPRTGLVTYYSDFNYHNEPDAFVTRVGGKPMVIRLYGRDGQNIARALKQMGTSNMNSVVKVLHSLTTLQSRLSTQWNPNFTIPNFVRDIGEAFINLQAQDQQRFVSQFTKHVAPAMRGAFQALMGRPGGQYAQAFRDFDRAGGRIRFFGMDDPTDIAANVRRKMRRMEGGLVNNMINAGSKAANAFEIVNGAVENATRLAAFMAARDVGMSTPDAAMLARNLTVDFNKKGEWGPAINAAYMFANASIQGTARLGRALAHKRVRRAAYGLAAMGAAGALYNILVGGDDDDGTPYYAKIKPYIRDKNLILMWPKGWGADGKYVKVPLPYGFSPFHVIGDRAVGVAMGKDKVSAAGHAILSSVADAFNPLGEESSLAMTMVPTLLRPALHIATNKNWTGGPIYPDHDYDKTKPDSEKSFESNSAFSKEAARDMNAATGGSRYKSGWLDVHPGSIDHVLETITGGLGRFVSDLVKTGGAVISGNGFDETKAPVLRRFVGNAKDPQADASAYYEAREEARKDGGENLRQARKDRRQGVNTEEADAFVRENARSGEAIFKAADQRMKPLRDRRARILESTDMSADQKQRELGLLTEQMREIQNVARKRYRELKERASP